MRFPRVGLDLHAVRYSAFAALAVTMLSGCSASAVRLGDAFSNPFQSASDDAVTTGTNAVQPLKTAALRKPPRQTMAAGATPSPIVRTPLAAAPLTTGAIGGGSRGGWVAEGGTPVVVAQGETAAVLAMRYGVPLDDTLRINGFTSSAQVQPGTRLIIPAYSAGASGRAAPTPVVARAPAAVAAPVAAPAPVRQRPVVAAAPVKAPQALPVKVAKAKPVKPIAPVVVAQAEPVAAPVKKIKTKKPVTALVPTEPVAAVAPVAAPNPNIGRKPTKPQIAAAPAAVPVKVAAVPAVPLAAPAAPRAVDPTPTASLPTPAPVATADGNPEFRWPARGRIIQPFQSGSGGNDGINIAVPEGTSVKAAEGGVVAYAGSELKGYGNLVLIKHPNGFVSAYANNGSLEVKRGDQVKRGQIVAKSGQSGNVSSPQLHFELRKGSTPVDPTNYLAGL